MAEITRLNERLHALEEHMNRDHDFDQQANPLTGSSEKTAERDSSRD